jgi:hypothetical protein
MWRIRGVACVALRLRGESEGGGGMRPGALGVTVSIDGRIRVRLARSVCNKKWSHTDDLKCV